MSKTTKWYPGKVKPVRAGVYQRKIYGKARYAKWDGKYWLLSAGTLDDAKVLLLISDMQSLP